MVLRCALALLLLRAALAEPNVTAAVGENVTVPFLAPGEAFSVRQTGSALAWLTALSSPLGNVSLAWTNGSARCTGAVEASLRIASTSNATPPAYALLVDLDFLPYRTYARYLAVCYSAQEDGSGAAWVSVSSRCNVDGSADPSHFGTSSAISNRVCTGTEFASLLHRNARLDCPKDKYGCTCSSTSMYVVDSDFQVPWAIGSVLFIVGLFLFDCGACFCRTQVKQPMSNPGALWSTVFCLCAEEARPAEGRAPFDDGTGCIERWSKVMATVGALSMLLAYSFGLPGDVRRPDSFLYCRSMAEYRVACLVLGLVGIAYSLLSSAGAWNYKCDGFFLLGDPRKLITLGENLLRARILFVAALLLVLPSSNTAAAVSWNYGVLVIMGIPYVFLWAIKYSGGIFKSFCAVFCCMGCSWCCCGDGCYPRDAKTELSDDTCNNWWGQVERTLLSIVTFAAALYHAIVFSYLPCYADYRPDSTCA
jgi:hypothetical protein